MKKIYSFFLLIVLCSCSSKISTVEKLAINFFKGETLDPEQFELIMIETSEVTERDLEVEKIRKSIRDTRIRVRNWLGLERLKRNPESANIDDVSNYEYGLGDSFDSHRASLAEYQSQYRRNPNSSYTRTLRESLLSSASFAQSLLCTSPNNGDNAIRRYEKEISALNNDVSDSPISRYDVTIRFYAMNRLGTRGITDASIEVYTDEEGELVLGIPNYR